MGITPKILINDGTLTSSSDYAIYAPAQDGVTTINGGTIMGYWGAIQLKRGTLDISGGTFENNGVSSVTKPDDQHDGLRRTTLRPFLSHPIMARFPQQSVVVRLLPKMEMM